MKKPVEIEKLLRWAFREELPKGNPVSLSAWDSIAQFGTLGTRVDVSGFGGGDGLGFVPGAPHDDALKIGDAVRALDRETRLDAEQCRALLGDYAPCDPLAISAIMGAAFSMPALIIRCAVLGSRMEWDLGAPQLRAVPREDNGRPLVCGEDENGELMPIKADKRGYYDPWLFPRTQLRYIEPSIGELLEARAEYVIWVCAMTQVAHALEGELSEHAAMPPAARIAPWLTGQAPAPTVLLPLAARRFSGKLPLSPERGIKAGPPLESAIEAKSKHRGREGARRASPAEIEEYARNSGLIAPVGLAAE